MAGLKSALRPHIATVLWPLVRPVRRRIERGYDGRRLRPGITAIVVARDEGYTIPFALRSLIGFADQIICVDNGSEDETLGEMEAFRDQQADAADIQIVPMPGALVGECWNAGLERTRHQWFSPWDADMVARTSGPSDIAELRRQVLDDSRPRTIALPTVNVFGDLHHVLRFSPRWEPGEAKLFRFGRAMRYQEFGRYYAVRLPLHFIQTGVTPHYWLHLAGVKSDENLMHRFHYWNWRDTVNKDGAALDPELRTLEGYKRRRNEELFGTNDSRSLKFRYQRQLSYHLGAYDVESFGDYPDVLKETLAGPQRFEVIYRDGRPWSRIDHEDEEMAGYEPTEADLAWDPETFLRRFMTSEQLRQMGVDPASSE